METVICICPLIFCVIPCLNIIIIQQHVQSFCLYTYLSDRRGSKSSTGLPEKEREGVAFVIGVMCTQMIACVVTFKPKSLPLCGLFHYRNRIEWISRAEKNNFTLISLWKARKHFGTCKLNSDVIVNGDSTQSADEVESESVLLPLVHICYSDTGDFLNGS